MRPTQAQALLPEETCPRCGEPAIRLMQRLVCSDIRCPWERARFKGRGDSKGQARPVERRAATQATRKKRASAERKTHERAAEQRTRNVFRVLRSDPWRTTIELAHLAGVKESSTQAILLDGLGRTTRRAHGDRGAHLWALIDEPSVPQTPLRGGAGVLENAPAHARASEGAGP